MKKKQIYEEKKQGAKERFDRAMGTIFQAPKGAKAGQAVKKKASPSRKSAADKGGS